MKLDDGIEFRASYVSPKNEGMYRIGGQNKSTHKGILTYTKRANRGYETKRKG